VLLQENWTVDIQLIIRIFTDTSKQAGEALPQLYHRLKVASEDCMNLMKPSESYIKRLAHTDTWELGFYL
jgi:hypothetical protein